MIDWKTFRPILVVPAIPIDNGISFLRMDQQMDIHGEMVRELWSILGQCNGYKDINEIVSNTKLEKNKVKAILTDLKNNNLIYDSNEQYLHFHSLSSYPAYFVRHLNEKQVLEHKQSQRKPCKKGENFDFLVNSKSNLLKIQNNRCSCRNYSSTKKLTMNELGNICLSAYSIKRHVTPSGGGLYPLKIYCIVTKNQIDFQAGYYEYDSENDKLILYNNEPNIEQLKYCFNDETLAFNSPIQIVICADLNRQPYKYSNRGYRLTLIEVGQAAQNISLYCEEQGISTCELGGILDTPMALELKIDDDDIYPILAIAIGYRDDISQKKYLDLLKQVNSKYVGEQLPIKKFGVNKLDVNNASFYGAWAKYGARGEKIAGATASSYNEAVCKAIIEAYERYQSSAVRIDYTGPVVDSKKFILPDEIAPLSKQQRKKWNLCEYKSNDFIDWTLDMSKKIYLPTDYIFYGFKKNNKLFFGDSSGIAAYSNYEEAKKRATAELIERDAIMRSWYQKKAPKHLNNDMLPVYVKNRKKHWKKNGREVHILELESKFLPVFLTVIVSDKYPCFVSGAASSIGNVSKAIIKSFQEAEYNLLLAKDYPIIEPILKDDITSPKDHGHFYYSSENSSQISWLWSNNEVSNTIYDDKYNFEKIYKDLEIIFVDLSDQKQDFIKVIRAISKKLIPISFGYERDYYLHPEVQKLSIDKSIKNYPHYFA